MSGIIINKSEGTQTRKEFKFMEKTALGMESEDQSEYSAKDQFKLEKTLSVCYDVCLVYCLQY